MRSGKHDAATASGRAFGRAVTHLLAAVFTVLFAALPSEAVADPSLLPAGYFVDTHHAAQHVTDTSGERGPPAECERHTTDDAVCPWLLGVSARLGTAPPPTATTCNHPTLAVQVAGIATTSEGPAQAIPAAHSSVAIGGVAANAGTRLAQDVAVSPIAPNALGLGRSIGRASHNQALQAEIAALPRGATGIRVNQQQVNALGQRVGINRPDLQYSLNGQRYYVEYEGLANPRGALHEARILANDPGSNFILRLVP